MKLLLKREYKKHLTRGTFYLNGKLLCKTLEPSIHLKSIPCPEGNYRLECEYDEECGWYLYFEADGRRFEIRVSSETGATDTIVPVTFFKRSIPLFTRLACKILTDKVIHYMGEREEVWLEIYSDVKPSKQNLWKLNPQNTLLGQEA
ncbi:DUF5675 family protein [Aquiflexum gelatinilyticum]|uniref:DUF5675 family protein n=1 Tax=Aquiflexum gelatinilyticum TaxID=2961943 RepID=UPI00216A73F9|nr:DUF5675 family protein [Aquiflexum gelatinilyticum]MCS4434223.1 DUF5675 family protein [Aquiflexum gelatinilyticum]